MSRIPIIENPEKEDWTTLLARPVYHHENLDSSVREILDGVKKRGDRAVDEYTRQFDQVSVKTLMVRPDEFIQAENNLEPGLKTAIQHAKENISRFHRNQVSTEPAVDIQNGVRCWRKPVAIEKVGLYIPGGTAPLFSTLLMVGVPAVIAGCSEIIVCTPPQKDGTIHPAILYSAQLAGIQKIFRVGGVQAIGAMAYGTETIPNVFKIFGPGNQWVTHAKKIVQQDGIGIDMPAGPSELAIYADETSIPGYVAADLLSQCEHGQDSQTILVTCSRIFADKVNAELEQQLEKITRRQIAEKSISNSKIFILEDPDESMELLNQYAPEHLILVCRDADRMADKVRNAGSVFIGNYAPESAGDYASGTNHVLPTNGFARVYGGVSVDSFVKKITFQQLTLDGLHAIGETVIRMALAEGLQAHAAAVEIRMKQKL
jgi:histidinol dehydrogenase